MSKKAIVLNSGGADSSTCVGIAVADKSYDEVVTVSVMYGQKHDKELRCANLIAQHYGLRHYELDLSNVLKYSNCSLMKQSTEVIPEMSYADQIKENGEGKVSTYVPFRNGLMLSAVASLAQSIFSDDNVDIFIGAHADDAAGRAYADCSEEFVEAMNSAICIGTYDQVKIVAPLVNMNKAQVIGTGLKLKVPYEKTYSCYQGGEHPCHKCGTCRDREEAFLANGVVDPLCKEDN